VSAKVQDLDVAAAVLRQRVADERAHRARAEQRARPQRAAQQEGGARGPVDLYGPQ
jgi:hypothetical protein